MSHIAIIGAGITGITTAYALNKRGYDVTVIDRCRYSAMETSFANGGQLSVSNAEVWNHWSTLLKGIKWLTQSHAPLLFNPLPSWHKYSWMAEFVGNIPNYRKNTIQTAKLALSARQYLLDIAKKEQIQFDYEQRGILHIYRNKSSFKHAVKVNKLLEEAGLERFSVSSDDIKAIEPTLEEDLYGGFYTPSDSSGDIHKFVVGLSQVCERKGVNFKYDTSIDNITHDLNGIQIETQHGEPFQYDAVVICSGISSRDFARQVGDRLNIYPVKGYSITVDLKSQSCQDAAPWVSLLDDETKIVASRFGKGRYRVAGTAEFNGINLDIRRDRVQPLIDWVRGLFPNVSTEHVIPWAGLRPMTPNMMPRVGQGKSNRVFYNTGHGHLGWTLSAATAEVVSESIQQNISPVKLHKTELHKYNQAA